MDGVVAFPVGRWQTAPRRVDPKQGEDRAGPFRVEDVAGAALEEPPKGFHDRGIGLMASQGKFHEARVQLTQRAALERDGSVYLDGMRLERLAPATHTPWSAWFAQGLLLTNDFAERIPPWITQHEVGRVMAEGRVTWQALAVQRSVEARLRLFTERLAYLLWQGRTDQALDALDEEAFIEHCTTDAEAQRVALAALYAAAWDEPERAEPLAVRYAEAGASAATTEAKLVGRALQHAAALQKVSAVAPCPLALLRALYLGPVFAGAASARIAAALHAELRAEPAAYLAFCEAAADRAPKLLAWMATTLAALEPAAGEATAKDAASELSLAAVERGLASDPLPRALWGGGAALTAALAVSALWIGTVGWVLAGVSVLAVVLLARWTRGVVHARSLRRPVARAMAASSVGVLAVTQAMARHPRLAPYAGQVAADPALALFGALACIGT